MTTGWRVKGSNSSRDEFSAPVQKDPGLTYSLASNLASGRVLHHPPPSSTEVKKKQWNYISNFSGRGCIRFVFGLSTFSCKISVIGIGRLSPESLFRCCINLIF